MCKLTVSKANNLISNISLNRYSTWEEFGYHKAKVYHLNNQTWLEHRKDDEGCTIRGIDNKYGYNGLKVNTIDLLSMNGKVFLRVVSSPCKSDKMMVDYFPLEVDQ